MVRDQGGLQTDGRGSLSAYFQDGLFELAFGLALALLGAFMLVAREMMYMAWFIPYVVMSLSLPAAKKRWVAPRGGTVALEVGKRRKVLMVLVLAGLVFLLMGLVVFTAMAANREIAWLAWLPLVLEWLIDRAPTVAGIALAVVMGKLAQTAGVARFWLYALALALGGVLATLLIAGRRMGTLAVLVGVGVPIAVVGLVRFLGFLRANPAPSEAQAAP